MTTAPAPSTLAPAPRRRAAAAFAAVLVAAVPLLSGCFSGFDATTTYQSQVPSGDGQFLTLGDLSLQNFTLVQQENGGNAVLIGTVFNNGTEADRVTRVTIDGNDAELPSLATTVEPQRFLGFGEGGLPADGSTSAPALWAEGFDAAAGNYAMVAMTFERSGIVEFDALVVPATGFYADVVAPVG